MANCQNNMQCARQRTGYTQRPSCRRGMMEPWRDEMRRDNMRQGDMRRDDMRRDDMRRDDMRRDDMRRDDTRRDDIRSRMPEQRCDGADSRKPETRCEEDGKSKRPESENRGGRNRKEDRLSGLPLAMAYVPWQRWRNVYDISKGFHRGTIFEELDKPFLGRGGCNR